MPRSLVVALSVTDIAFLTYWSVAALAQLGVVEVPPEWMYADYDQPRVVAWNWSFFPLDIAFSIFGLRSVAAARAGDARWRPYALVSLVLTMTAGGMAVTYWALLGEIDPFWFLSNLALVIWPLFFIGPLLSPSIAEN